MTEIDKSKALEDSLYSLLLPVAEECNSHIDDIAAAQKALSDQIDKLVTELERLKTLTQCPTAFSPYSKKLISCRNRVDAASRALTSVETRVTKMTVGLRKLQPQVFETQYQKKDSTPTEPVKGEKPKEEEKEKVDQPQNDTAEKEDNQNQENIQGKESDEKIDKN